MRTYRELLTYLSAIPDMYLDDDVRIITASPDGKRDAQDINTQVWVARFAEKQSFRPSRLRHSSTEGFDSHGNSNGNSSAATVVDIQPEHLTLVIGLNARDFSDTPLGDGLWEPSTSSPVTPVDTEIEEKIQELDIKTIVFDGLPKRQEWQVIPKPCAMNPIRRQKLLKLLADIEAVPETKGVQPSPEAEHYNDPDQQRQAPLVSTSTPTPTPTPTPPTQ